MLAIPRALLFVALLGLLTLMSAPSRASERLTQAQALRELGLLERALVDLHPGLYRYQDEAGLSVEFETARRAVSDGAEPIEMYALVTRIAASVRCGHTWTNPLNQSEPMRARLAALPTLPLRVRLLQGRLLVTASAHPDVQRFDEILAIDGRTVSALVRSWMPYLRADGSSDGKRLIQLGSAEGGEIDRLLPLLNPPGAGGYRLMLGAPDGSRRRLTVAAMQAADREALLTAAGQPPAGKEWQLQLHGDAAVLTLPTFAFWNSDFDWRGFLLQSFQRLQREDIQHLVLDLRRNEGGDAAIGHALLGHLVSAPYAVPNGRAESAYERVPYALARYLDTWNFSFFDRTGSVVRGAGRNWLLDPQPAAITVAPQELSYSGRVTALIGPQMSSAGFLLARDLKRSGVATLIGEATGGNRRGLNGGQLAWLSLPHSGVAVDIPLLASVHEGEPDAGIRPDIEVQATVEDARAEVDTALQRALAREGSVRALL